MNGRNVIRKIIFIIGFLICIYPLGSSIIESFYQREAIATYENAVNNIDRAELELEYNKAEEYNSALFNYKNNISCIKFLVRQPHQYFISSYFHVCYL